jgi:hypothetical protein
MADEPCDRDDEVSIGPGIGGNARVCMRHTADHRQIPGIMRPIREGEPLTGHVVTIEPKDPQNGIYRVTGDLTIPSPHAAQMSRGKPAKVSTEAFRTGWENVFGKQTIGQA